MKTLYKTSDVVKFLIKWDCDLTANSIKEKAAGAEFIESDFVKAELIEELYKHLDFELNKYTYLQG
jgi:hypothetical protein